MCEKIRIERGKERRMAESKTERRMKVKKRKNENKGKNEECK